MKACPNCGSARWAILTTERAGKYPSKIVCKCGLSLVGFTTPKTAEDEWDNMWFRGQLRALKHETRHRGP